MKWRIDDMPLPRRGFVRIIDDYGIVCHIPKKGRAKYYAIKQLDEKTQTDINLIDAAPELLEACEHVCQNLKQESEEVWAHEISHLSFAINKAKQD